MFLAPLSACCAPEPFMLACPHLGMLGPPSTLCRHGWLAPTSQMPTMTDSEPGHPTHASRAAPSAPGATQCQLPAKGPCIFLLTVVGLVGVATLTA